MSIERFQHSGGPVQGFDRRAFIATSAVAAAGASLLARPLDAHAEVVRRSRRLPRCTNIIFMASDGMSSGTLALADLMSRRRDGKGSRWVDLWKRPGVLRATAFTASADSPVTDSAAGGSSWGCGFHVKNEVLNITPDGTPRTPILIHAKAAGKATGVVTTTRITHATPASFYANSPKRDLEDLIASQLLERNIDLAFGGGEKHFPASLLGKHGSPTVVRTREAMLALAGEAQVTRAGAEGKPAQVLGLFDKDHVPYVLDTAATAGSTVPSLAEMTSVALTLLGKRSEGFVLQVEGGRVDHAAHNNDAGSLVAEQLAFDAAIGVVLDFVKDRDDTLVILTSDHGNANPGLTFYGPDALTRFDRILHVKRSAEWVFEKLNLKSLATLARQVREVGQQATGITLSEAESQMVVDSLAGKRVSPFAAANTPVSVLGGILADSLGVAFLSPNHTSDMVEVTALGPGSESLPRVIDSTDLWAVMIAVLELDPAANHGK